MSYSDNTEIGMATVTVAGMGNYYGTAAATFYITAAPAGWQFKIEDMEYVGNVLSAGAQNARLLSVDEAYNAQNALLVAAAFLDGRFLFGQSIAKNIDGKIHVSGMSSSVVSASGGSSGYKHALWISADGGKSYWRNNNTSKLCCPATSAVGYDFANLSFDTESPVDLDELGISKNSSLVFSSDGSRVFSWGFSDSIAFKKVSVTNLSTPYDLSSATSASTLVELTELPSTGDSIFALHFSPNGYNVLVAHGRTIYQFKLDEPFDLTQRTLVSSYTTSQTVFTGLAVVNNGGALFATNSNGYVYEYNLVASS